MNKFIKFLKESWVTLSIFSVITLSIYLYVNNYNPSCKNPNDNLGTINYGVQIGYNLCYIIIALAVLYYAKKQLNTANEQSDKTRESTNIQSLHTIIERYNGQEMVEKRVALARFILDSKGESFSDKITSLRNDFKRLINLEKEDFKYDDKIKVAKLKNRIEVIIYEFEVIGFFKQRNIYALKDVYELFSYEIQRYWLLIDEIDFINFLRDNKLSGEDGFYDKFQDLNKATIGFEINNGEGIIDLFDEEAIKIIEKKRDSLEMFVYEESLLLDYKSSNENEVKHKHI